MAPGAGRLASRALRGGRWSLLGLALVVALGGGASLTAAVAAHRTDHAYGAYVRDAAIADLVVNPSVRTREIDEAIRGFDGVEAVRVDTLLFASVVATGPVRIADAPEEDAWLQVKGSTDGRYVDVDRPAVSEGRVPSGDREVFVSSDYRPELEQILGRPLAVGDHIDVGFFWAGSLDGYDLDPDAVIEPLGVESLRIVGFGLLPNEVLPEELFPRQQLIVSEDVTARYWCLETLGDATTYDEALQRLIPPDCAASYEYYSLTLRDGSDGTASIRRQFDEAAERLNRALPEELAEQGVGYYYISQDRSDTDAAVRETIRPTVVTLQAFALVAALATVTITGLVVARQTRRDREVQRSLRALGATRGEITRWSAAPPLAAVLVGLLAGLALAFALSPIGPLGTVRALAPSPGRSLPAAAALPTATGLAVVLTTVIVAVRARSAWRAARAVDEAEAWSGRASRLVRHGRPSATTGVGAALDTRRAGVGLAAMAGCVVATAAGAAAIVFGASLTELVDEPDTYGWPWEVAVLTGAGYGDTAMDVVDERLAQPDVRDDIVDHGFYSFDPAVVFDGQPAPVIFGWAGRTAGDLPVRDGRAPARAGETLLGEDTAEQLGLGIGDTVAIESLEFGSLDLDVVGIGVLPSLGPFVADRAGLGTGAYTLVDAAPSERSSPAFTGIRLRDGADATAVLDRLRDDLPTWSLILDTPVAHDEPVRSAEIVNLSQLRAAPLVLGGGLLVALALGLWLAVTLSVRDRRRELAVLRALGFASRDVRGSVRWQGMTLVVVGIVGGIPLGIVAGRAAWGFFADQLGVIPATSVPLTWLALQVILTAGLGWLAVALPARAAARVSPTEELAAR